MTNSRSHARRPAGATTLRRGLVLVAALVAALGGTAGVAGTRDGVQAHVHHPVRSPVRGRRASTPPATPARATLVRFVRPLRTAALRDGASATPPPEPVARRLGPGAGTTDGTAVVRHRPWWCGRAAWRAPPIGRVV